jgi:hypothetical protein
MKRMAAGASSSRRQCHGAAGNCINECGSEEGTCTGELGKASSDASGQCESEEADCWDRTGKRIGLVWVQPIRIEKISRSGFSIFHSMQKGN